MKVFQSSLREAPVRTRSREIMQFYEFTPNLPPTTSHNSSGISDGHLGQADLPSPGLNTLHETHGSQLIPMEPLNNTSSTSNGRFTSIEDPLTLDIDGPDSESEERTRNAVNRLADGEESVISLPKVNWEHHGPWSWVSICSQPGLKWVCETTGRDDFVDIACGLTNTWSRRLKIKRFKSFRESCPEPQPVDAWRYVNGKPVPLWKQ